MNNTRVHVFDDRGFNLPYTIESVWNESTFISESEVDLPYEEIIQKITNMFFYHLKRTGLSDSREFAERYTRDMLQECKD